MGDRLREGTAPVLETIKIPIKTLLREPTGLVWMLAFPILLSTVFMFMFSNLAGNGTMSAVPVAVVADDAWGASALSRVADALDEPGEDRLLEVREVSAADEGEALMGSGEVSGVLRVDAADGTPRLTLPTLAGTSSAASVDAMILQTVADSYAQGRTLVEELAATNPSALSDPEAIEDALGLAPRVERISLTRSTPDESVRFYYALLGMSTLMCAQLAAREVARAQPNTSVIGARRAASGTSRVRQLVGVLVGCWVSTFACLSVAFAFMRLVVGLDFAGREPLALAGLAAASLLSTALGALVGALPLRSTSRAGGAGDVSEARSGILTGLACLLSLFAGLYGEPTMELADAVARAVPAAAWLNPAKLICDLFYSLYYYDALGPFLLRVAACAAMSAALLAASSMFFRRQRYEQL